MERADWMNEAVRQETEDLQQTHGFEEDEAVAFWHLNQVGQLMGEMWQADFQTWRDRQEQLAERPPGWRLAVREADVAAWHANVQQHVWSLQRVLALRVLRRNFPDGWEKYGDEAAEEG